MARARNDFGFGIESEFLLLDSSTGRPLWWEDLPFAKLNAALEEVPVDPNLDLSALELEAPHRKVMPFVVEGYGVPDEEFRVIDVKAKGVEIRTPVATSLDSCLNQHQELYQSLDNVMLAKGWRLASLSHHPVAEKFTGPQNKRRHDFWQWAMQAMTTYGPDINVSLPLDFAKHFDLKEFESKVYAYSAAMAAFSLSSPFLGGKPWQINGRTGKSVRTWRRSIVAPPIEFHPDEDGRLEFKVFEMSPLQSDYRNYFLLFLTLALDEELRDRAERAEWVYTSGEIARDGLASESIQRRAHQLLDRAQIVLPRWGFNPQALQSFEKRLERKRTPADDLLDQWAAGQTLNEILKTRTGLRDDLHEMHASCRTSRTQPSLHSSVHSLP
jgi:hypothetical protein